MAVNHPFDTKGPSCIITTNISFLSRNPFKHNLYIRRKTLEKTEENGQSRDTGSIGMKTNKHVTQKTKATSNTDQQSGMKPGVCEG
jgi:hypothetical protein